MSFWFLVFGLAYVSALLFSARKARISNRNEEDFAMAGSELGVFLGCLTVAATLFSTFTLMGMPDFFRTNGIGAWIFLGISDAIFAFMILWFGFYLRRKANEKGFKGIAGLMRDCYESNLAGYVYLVGIFIFLIPYVAVQIKGIGLFLTATFPELLPAWGWAVVIVSVITIYSSIGGLKAIVYADAIQGCVLLLVTLIISYGCLKYFGSVSEMFSVVRETNDSLLSVPGPNKLFGTQFLIASIIVIVMLPITQPQISVRMVLMKDLKSMMNMSVWLGVFAMILILAIIPIGMYGAAKYPDLPAIDFLAKVLVHDQTPLVAAAAAIGLIAAAISTADSQIFALGNECRSMLGKNSKDALVRMRFIIVSFALLSLIVALLSSDQLVLIARVSFAGTSLLAPMIVTAILREHRPSKAILVATVIGMIIFLLSLFELFPSEILTIRMDLALFLTLSAIAIISVVIQNLGRSRVSAPL